MLVTFMLVTNIRQATRGLGQQHLSPLVLGPDCLKNEHRGIDNVGRNHQTSGDTSRVWAWQMRVGWRPRQLDSVSIVRGEYERQSEDGERES